jgi:hypothetical protein
MINSIQSNLSQKTEIDITGVPKGFSYLYSKKELRQFLKELGDDHPFINRILCNGIRYEEMRGYPKILADSELSRGIRLGIAIFGNQYCDMNFQATRHLPPESLEMLNDSKQQILKQIADWYKSKNLLPETQRQQSAQLTIRLIKEPNRTVRLFISP